MNNQYRNIPDLSIVGVGSQEPEITEGKFDGGIVLNVSPQDIELNQTPEADIVRVRLGALRQDYNVIDVGSAAATKVLALGEHKYVVSGDEIYGALFRMYLFSQTVATVEIDTWDGGAFVAAINEGGTDSLTLERVLASWKSYFDQVFFATGGDILRWIRSSAFTSRSTDFADTDNLTAVNDTVLSKAITYADEAVNDTFFVHYSVTITGPSATGAQIILSFIDGQANVVSVLSYNLPTSTETTRSLVYAHEIREIVGDVSDDEKITLKLVSITQSPVARIETLVNTGSQDFQVTKAAVQESSTDVYVYTYTLAFSGTADVNIYYDKGAGWVLEHTIVGESAGTNEWPTDIDGMGAGDKFRVVLTNRSDGAFPSLTAARVDWDEPFTVVVHGFNVAEDTDVTQGITYETEGSVSNALIDVPKSIAEDITGTATAGGGSTLTDAGAFGGSSEQVGDWVYLTAGTGVGQLRKIVSHTIDILTIRPAWGTQPDNTSEYQVGTPTYAEARYLGIFNNRILLLQDGGDVEKIGWSLSGVPDVLFGDGAGSTIRPSYSSPVDALMGFAALSSTVGALFRQRSIERVVATGSIEPAQAFFRWLEEIGTESPFSITSVPGGLMFLGHDRMVYYLTESTLISVGQAIKEAFLDKIGDLGAVEGEYDPIAHDYIMAVPGEAGSDTAVSWFFDMDRFLREGVQVWQRHTRTMNRLAIVNSSDVYFVDGSKVIHTFDRDDVEDGAYWISPQLNRGNRAADYTLHRVVLRYEVNGVAPVIIIDATPDGGVTWKNGYKSSITLVDSQTAIFSVSQGFDNVTGSDLRFRVRFDTTGEVLLRSWRAELLERGSMGDDIT